MLVPSFKASIVYRALRVEKYDQIVWHLRDNFAWFVTGLNNVAVAFMCHCLLVTTVFRSNLGYACFC